MTLNLRIRIIVWWKGKLRGGGEPLKGSMGGNVPMAPLKPDHVLKGDVFGSCKKKTSTYVATLSLPVHS